MMSDSAQLTETRCLQFDRKYVIQSRVLPVIPYEVSLEKSVCLGLYQKLWQNRGGLHQFVFCYPMPSSSHGLSLLVETRNTVLAEIHVESEG